MKRLVVLSTILVLATGVAYASERGSIPTSEIPEVMEKTGSGDQTLETSYYPVMDVESGDYDDSCLALLKQLENKTISTTIGGKGAQHHRIDKDNDGSFVNSGLLTPLITDNYPIQLKDLEQTVNILPAHLRTAKILVFWTVRVVGQCLPLQITGDICDYYNAKTQFTCNANDVYTYVKVNDKLMDKNPCVLQIPAMTGGSSESEMYDPTITGTYVITPDDFGGQLPTTVKIQIYWQNKGSMRVTSPDGLRNLIVNVIPYSKADK